MNFRIFADLGAMLAVAGCVIGIVLWQLDFFRSDRQWTIATGDPAGNYHQLGEQLAELLNDKMGPRDQFQLLPSGGSAENVARIDSGDTDFAFVQSNANPAEDVRLIATLYDEVLHVLVRADLLESMTIETMPLQLLEPLDKVSIGPVGSGTSQVAQMLLEHLEIKLKGPALNVATSKLADKFAAGELDAAFVLSAPGSAAMDRLLHEAGVRLLALGSGPLSGSAVDGFATLHPAFQPRLIPAWLYGRKPSAAVQSVGVSALLVAAESTDFRVVRKVTDQLFSHRHRLTVGEATPLTLNLHDSHTHSSIPLHAGAEAFYHRENPSFLVVYAEVIALGITVAVGLWSIVRLFVHWLADVKKERIDRFYREAQLAAKLPEDARLAALREIHRRAFNQLMGEKLVANESFVIFHDYLLHEIGRAERDGS